jgi:MFS family permease
MFIASTLGMLGYVVSGALMDRIGRRATGSIFFFISAAALFLAFTSRGAMMMPSLIAAVFFIFALLPICSTYNAELFPTEIRADASAWCNFLLGRPAQVAAPYIVGALSGLVGGIGNAVAFLSIGPLAAAFIILKFLPETKGVKMDDIQIERTAMAEQ